MPYKHQPQNLPEGWKRVRLGEVIRESFSGEWGFEPSSLKNSYPVISTLAINIEGKIDFSKNTLRQLPFAKIDKLLLKKGDILIEKSGGSSDIPAGKVALLKKDFKGTASNFIQIVRVKSDVSPNFIFYKLLYDFWNRNTEKFQQKTTGIINFKLNEYFKSFIILPPLPEQQKIAEILETLDNAIEKTDKIIEKYKRIKQGLMQDLLTKGIDENSKIRNPKFHKFKNSPLGKIPEEWEVVRLGEVSELISGSTPDTNVSEFWNGNIVWITPEDLSKQPSLTISSSKRKITKSALKKNAIKLIPKNSIVISTRAPIGYIKVVTVDYTTNQGCKSIKFNENFNPMFLAYLLNTKVIEMINLSGGTTFYEISKTELSNLKIPLPPLPEQKRIAEILSQIDQTIEKETAYKEKLQHIKKGLMEDLLTGKVRVKII